MAEQRPAAVGGRLAWAPRSAGLWAVGETDNVQDMTYALLNKLTAKPGQRQQVVDILLESGTLLFPDNPDCHLYMVSEATEDPNVIWVTDVWTSKESHEEALKAPELRPYVEKSMPLLEGMPEQIEIRPVGGIGLPD